MFPTTAREYSIVSGRILIKSIRANSCPTCPSFVPLFPPLDPPTSFHPDIIPLVKNVKLCSNECTFRLFRCAFRHEHGKSGERDHDGCESLRERSREFLERSCEQGSHPQHQAELRGKGIPVEHWRSVFQVRETNLDRFKKKREGEKEKKFDRNWKNEIR